MDKRCVTPGIVLAGVIALLAFCGSAQTAKVIQSRRICVVAVHDSSLFTISLPLPTTLPEPLAWTTSGAPYPELMKLLPLHSFPEDRNLLDRARPDWQGLARTSQGICPSGWVDPEMKRTIEKEFRGRRGYTLVDSVENAELVFLAEGIYRSFYTYATSGRGGGKVYRMSVNNGDVGFGKRVLQAAMAVVVPSEIYSGHPADGEALLAARLWQGAVVWQDKSGSVPGVASARPAILAEQFINEKKTNLQDLYPVCAAWTSPPPTINGAETSSTARLKLKGTDVPPPPA